MPRCKKEADTNKHCKQTTIHKSGLCWRHDPDQHFLCGGSNPNGSTCKQKVGTDRRCKRHNDSIPTKKRVKKLFRCASIVKHGANKGKKCHWKVEIKGDICNRHPKKKTQLIEHAEEKCTKCGESVEWASMKMIGYDYYDISTIGQIYSYRSHKYLEGHSQTDVYIRFTLINDDNEQFNKRIHTLQGNIFYDLHIDNDRNITVDHIDRDPSNNRICCNLRPATRNEQLKNRILPEIIRGRTVLKISLNTGDVVKKYKSVVEAANDINMEYTDTMRRLCQKEGEHDGYLWRYENKADYGDIEWISSAKEFPDMPLFEGSENGDIIHPNGTISKGT